MGKLAITIEGYTFEIELDLLPDRTAHAIVRVDGIDIPVDVSSINREQSTNNLADQAAWFIVDGRPYEVVIDPDQQWIRSRWGIHQLEIQNLDLVSARPAVGNGRIKTPIPGQITQVMVAVGDEVEAGQPLLVLEAMKMENEIRAPHAGVVKSLNVLPGQRVALHEVLAEIE